MKSLHTTPLLLTLVAATLLAACTSQPRTLRRLPLIDTRTGTAPSTTQTAGLFGRHTEELGQTLPAVLEPHGMNFWTPQTQDTERKCVAPYYYRDSLLQGFRASHWIVGGCTQDYGSMTLMPLADSLRTSPQRRATPFSHTDETATPAYYAVSLPREGIRAEMTGRSRSAIFRFSYTRGGRAYLVIHPNSDEGQGMVEIDPKRREIRGYNPVHRIYQGWDEPAGFSGHFVVRLKKRLAEWGTFRGDSLCPGATRAEGAPGIGIYVAFDVKPGEAVTVKAATSFADADGAARNLESEIPHWDFDRTRRQLEDIWEKRLGLIDVEGGDSTALRLFYGSLYRASFLPRTFSDVDGRYPSFATGTPIRQMPEGQTYFDDFSMWDTYRALHPLITLLDPRLSGEMMQSLVLKYEQGGWLPIFPCWNSYTAAMIGDHCTVALADAYVKGVRGFDIATAYRAMRQNAFDLPRTEAEYRNGMGRRALSSYLKYGFIPVEDSVPHAFHTREQVSRTMEYAFDDFALAQVAERLERKDDYHTLMRRATNYRNVIDPRTGYANARRADSSFIDPAPPTDFAPFITEGAPCHYTWYAPHDPEGLMQAMGGREVYVARLDSMFTHGRYWHGNEPCHQVAYMYNAARQSWKTQRAVRHILQTEYQDAPGGLAGNDDAGQMSAWYVFSAMGFYPMCPATPTYELGSPLFPLVTLHPESEHPFRIRALDVSDENIYIQHATLNGVPWTDSWLRHEDIMRGGELVLQMGPEPSKTPLTPFVRFFPSTTPHKKWDSGFMIYLREEYKHNRRWEVR